MVLPRPWCSKNPKPCVQAVGISETIISVIAGILLVTLPFAMLDQDHEVTYIKQTLYDFDEETLNAYSPEKLWTLIITGTYRNDCNDIKQCLGNYLDEYLKDNFKYWIFINRTEKVEVKDPTSGAVGTEIHCVIHVQSRGHPDKKVVEVKGTEYSISDICALCLADYSNNASQSTIKNNFTANGPTVNQIAKQTLYPASIGNDPERVNCLNKIIRFADKEAVLELESGMYYWLTGSAVVSFIVGVLIAIIGYTHTNRLIVAIILILEVVSVVLLAIGLYMLNNEIMCLYQYGGLSSFSEGSPPYMQTIITYVSAVYAASFKFYSIWIVLAYAEWTKATMEKEEEPKISKAVAKVAQEVDKLNQDKGGDGADLPPATTTGEDDADSEEDELKSQKRVDKQGSQHKKSLGAPVTKSMEKQKAELFGKSKITPAPTTKPLVAESFPLAKPPPARVSAAKPAAAKTAKNPAANKGTAATKDHDRRYSLFELKTEDDPQTTDNELNDGATYVSDINKRRMSATRLRLSREKRGPERSLIPQKRDKSLFQQSFFGNP